MRKHVQCLMILTLVLILVAGLVGCNRDDSNDQILPGIPTKETPVQGNSERFTSFIAGRADSDKLGAYVGSSFFMVRVPADDYVLKYQTDVGVYYLAFRANVNAIVTVGLRPGNTVLNVGIAMGTLTDIGAETREYGEVTLYCWPGSAVKWWDVFSAS